MKIAIIFPLYNRLDLTQKAIASIQTSHEYKVICIDNGSTDGTVEWLRVQQDVDLLQSDNSSLSRSWNMGIAHAREKYGIDLFLICNNDIIFHAKTIDALVERKLNASLEPVGIVTPINVRGEIAGPEHLHEVPEKVISESPHPDFSCFLFDSKTYEEVGKFDEGFRIAYFEDNDYHYRMTLKNIKAIATTAAIYYHIGSQTQNQVIEGIVRSDQFMKNRAYFAQKHGIPQDIAQQRINDHWK